MVTSAELIQLRTRLLQVIAAHDSPEGQTTLEKLQGIGVTPVPGLSYFSAQEVTDLLANNYIRKYKPGVFVTPGSPISQQSYNGGAPTN